MPVHDLQKNWQLRSPPDWVRSLVSYLRGRETPITLLLPAEEGSSLGDSQEPDGGYRHSSHYIGAQMDSHPSSPQADGEAHGL